MGDRIEPRHGARRGFVRPTPTGGLDRGGRATGSSGLEAGGLTAAGDAGDGPSRVLGWVVQHLSGHRDGSDVPSTVVNLALISFADFPPPFSVTATWSCNWPGLSDNMGCSARTKRPWHIADGRAQRCGVGFALPYDGGLRRKWESGPTGWEFGALAIVPATLVVWAHEDGKFYRIDDYWLHRDVEGRPGSSDIAGRLHD